MSEEIISGLIYTKRNKLKYSKEDMAKLMDISPQTYRLYELHPKEMKLKYLQRLTEIFGCNITDFFVN